MFFPQLGEPQNQRIYFLLELSITWKTQHRCDTHMNASGRRWTHVVWTHGKSKQTTTQGGVELPWSVPVKHVLLQRERTARKDDVSSRWQLGLANVRIRCVFTLCRRLGRGWLQPQNGFGPCRCLSHQRAKRHWFLLLQESSTTIVSYSAPIWTLFASWSTTIGEFWNPKAVFWLVLSFLLFPLIFNPYWGWSPTHPMGVLPNKAPLCSCGMETATICLT